MWSLGHKWIFSMNWLWCEALCARLCPSPSLSGELCFPSVRPQTQMIISKWRVFQAPAQTNFHRTAALSIEQFTIRETQQLQSQHHFHASASFIRCWHRCLSCLNENPLHLASFFSLKLRARALTRDANMAWCCCSHSTWIQLSYLARPLGLCVVLCCTSADFYRSPLAVFWVTLYGDEWETSSQASTLYILEIGKNANIFQPSSSGFAAPANRGTVCIFVSFDSFGCWVSSKFWQN